MKKYILLILIFSLIACKSIPEYKILYKQDKINISNKESLCKLVDSINDIKVEKENIFNDKIYLDKDIEITCPENKDLKLGKLKLVYKTEFKNYEHIVEVVDNIAPTISLKHNYYEVDLGNKYFDINNEFKIEDDYDEKPNFEIEGKIDIEKEGTYKVKIIATDSSLNTSYKTVEVKVFENKETIKETVPVYVEALRNGNTSRPSNDYSYNSWPQNIQQNPQPSKAPFINGVKDITVGVDSDLNDMVFYLTSAVSASASLSVDYSNVNLSVPGAYAVYYYSSDGASASCTVNVQ